MNENKTGLGHLSAVDYLQHHISLWLSPTVEERKIEKSARKNYIKTLKKKITEKTPQIKKAIKEAKEDIESKVYIKLIEKQKLAKLKEFEKLFNFRFCKEERKAMTKTYEFKDIEIDLTDREKDVYNLLVDGVSYKDAAKILNVTQATIKTHVNTLFLKLQVNSLVELVVKHYKRVIKELQNEERIENNTFQTLLQINRLFDKK